jgi:hypothetical protein
VAAKLSYLRSLELHTLSPTVFIGLGMVAQIGGELDESIRRYHEVSYSTVPGRRVFLIHFLPQALALSPQDPVATVLLDSALTSMTSIAQSVEDFSVIGNAGHATEAT